MFGNPFERRDDLKSENKSAPYPFGRLGDDDEPDTEIADIKNPTKLASSVGDSGQNSRRDVAKTEQLLGKAGALDLKKTDGPTGYWGTRTSDATKVFQKQHGLKVDGQINPNGETILALGKLAGQAVKAAQSSNTRPAPAKFFNSKSSDDQASTTRVKNKFVIPDLIRDDKDVERSGLTDDAFAENQRAARYLASRDGIGEFSKFVADGIETDGNKAIAETVDLYSQTRELNQKQADALIDKVIPELSGQNAKRLQSAIIQREDDQLGNPLNPDHLRKALNIAQHKRDAENEMFARVQVGAANNQAHSDKTKLPEIEEAEAPELRYPNVQNFGGTKSVTMDMPPPTNLKGTTFFGGAGMNGEYIPDMQKAFQEVGMKNVRAANPDVWSNGIFRDATGSFFERNRDDDPSDFSHFKTEGEQFNLVGYSHGAQQAAQAAADYADGGGTVDNLVLIGAPVSQEFLDELKSHPNIKNVIVKDLTEYGDDIHAGMSAGEQLLAAPFMGLDINDKRGHFYYSKENEEGLARRRHLAQWLKQQGLK